jgi:copper resistance protein D
MLAWLIPDFDLLSVLLRAATLSIEALVLGGVIFLAFDAAPMGASLSVRNRLSRTTAWFALALAITQAFSAVVSSAVLAGTTGLHFADLITANYFLADCVLIGSALLLWILLLRGGGSSSVIVFSLPSLLLLCASTALSHAASRVDHRVLLLVLTAAHHLGTAAWIGAMPHLFIALGRTEDSREALRMVQAFSVLAITGVLLLIGAGAGMAWFYVGSMGALYGTSYGVMLIAKIYLLLVILMLGAGNFFLARRVRSEPAVMLQRLRCFSEVEIAMGFTIILIAASLTSQPPAVDLVQDRLTRHEIVQRLDWRWPSLKTPSVAQLTPPEPIEEGLRKAIFSSSSVNDANDRAWSEYNHNWAGLIVLAAGSVALIAKLPKQRWAQNWPLLFIGLAIFLILRADPENWPLGPRSFWESFSSPDVLEHRLYALLIIVFAVFEWGVETGRLKWQKASLVFPTLCCLGGALLLTHSHALGNVKEEMLAEMSHTSVALLGVITGSSRWLELSLPDRPNERNTAWFTAWIWPICLMLVGLVLLDYRES